MKNADQRVLGSVILNQWCNDNVTVSEHVGFNIEPDTMYLVKWPDHVTTPKFNCDCEISEIPFKTV